MDCQAIYCWGTGSEGLSPGAGTGLVTAHPPLHWHNRLAEYSLSLWASPAYVLYQNAGQALKHQACFL